jgi:predicted phage terminase large subunit-like protein
METTLPSRKVDKEVVPLILIQQRLHQGDPTGEILSKAATANRESAIRHICLPGELTSSVAPPELKLHYVNDLLDPIRLSREALEQAKKDLGAYGYASQILQDPVPLGGGLFKTDLIVPVIEEPEERKFTEIVRSWDKAGTKDGGMYSVGLKMGRHVNGSYWVLDVARGQWSSREREDRIRAIAEMDGAKVPILLEIEAGSGGKESGESTVVNLAGFHTITFRPTGEKEARAYPLSSQVGAGNVFVLQRHWTREFLEELKFFPHSRFKDQVDAASAAFNHLSKKKVKIGGYGRMTPHRESPTRRGAIGMHSQRRF